jgi:hypothetical protein
LPQSKCKTHRTKAFDVLLAELRHEADQWRDARQRCTMYKHLLTDAVAAAVEEHKKTLDNAAEETFR